LPLKCKYCKSDEELKWPENYKKGDRPVNAETGAKHECVKDNTGFLDTTAPNVGTQSTLTETTNTGKTSMVGPAQTVVIGLSCNLCETPLINCGCANCSHFNTALFCPTCEIHPGGKKP